ncbi:endo alpha-1,4 polygalactosaminidase [Cellulomonas palmilytica]|uniref:endo alpha-1,4 polygalactosaminidase n=1 Tax=Cellulomonas palmilytica TaxID=2608402 RepID=UPI001F44959A|nr:endo alpha-1,4 polygalactosaminidase [Cellulomonas palmilytica]UJP40192.1 endo alpha-1,4 polygalactosaminidase [Cellulomonas palmilytica]
MRATTRRWVRGGRTARSCVALVVATTLVTLAACTATPDPPPTAAATAAPSTAAATVAATAAASAIPSAIPSAVPSAAARIALPAPGSSFEYQIGGAEEPLATTRVVIRDATERPSGRYDVCYVNGFQTQPDETERLLRDAPELVLHDDGEPVRDEGWPDEALYDLRTAALRTRVAERVAAVMDRCAAAGFDAVEIDNLDSYTRSRGLITASHALAHAELLVDHAHARGLAFAQKNSAELTTKVRALGADLAVTEECQEWDECAVFTAAYPVVLDVEYDRPAFETVCARQARSSSRDPALSVVLRDRDVSPRSARGAVHETC